MASSSSTTSEIDNDDDDGDDNKKKHIEKQPCLDCMEMKESDESIGKKSHFGRIENAEKFSFIFIFIMALNTHKFQIS